MSCSPSPPEPARAVKPAAERRRQQRSIVGGHRATDPPLTTRECADWMGMGTTYIVRGRSRRGTLKAERFGLPGRKRAQLPDSPRRLHSRSCRKIGFQRLPKSLP
jgi:hypothetical protein